MKKVSLIIACLFLVLGSFANSFNSGTIHMIMVADEYSNIANSCSLDKENMQDLMEIVEYKTGLKVKFYYPGFSRDEVLETVNNISVGSNDVIFFYYTGHGFRYRYEQEDDYPFMFLTTSTGHPDDVGLGLKNVSDILRGKNARLTITLGDLCNSYVNLNMPEPLSPSHMKEAYMRLFVYAEGYVLGTSSKPGQTSIATSNGSIYTNALIDAFEKETKPANATKVTWDKLLNTTNKYVQDSGRDMDPVFETSVRISN